MTHNAVKLAALALVVCDLSGARTWAQTTSTSAPQNELTEILVTAERRTETLQQVAVSMDAISGQTLENLGVNDFFDYATSIPNLSVGLGTGAGGSGNGFGVSSARSVTIRGVAGNNTTAFYIDDTPLPLSLDPRVLDVERIEVLRGPQGTLFGSGSMGGTIRMITQQPSLEQSSGSIQGEGYDMNHGGAGYSISGVANVPLIPGEVALRVNAFSSFTPGYFTREWGVPTVPGIPLPPGAPSGSLAHVADDGEAGASASLRIEPSAIPGLTVTPMIIWQRSASNGMPLADNDPSDLTQARPLNVEEAVGDYWTFTGLTGKYHTGIGNVVGSVTHFARDGYDDEDGTDWTAQAFGLPTYVAAAVPSHLYVRTWTGEARFESTLDGPMQFLVGVFSDVTNRTYEQYMYTAGANALTGGALGTDLEYFGYAPNTDRQRAAFTNLTYAVTSEFELTAGVRRAYLAHEYSYTANGYANGGPSFNTGSTSQSVTTPRYTAKYQYLPNHMLYASAAEGFRIGGVNYHLPSLCDADLAAAGLTNGGPYVSDSLWSYEVGSKNSWADGRIKTRLAAYRINWKNIQQITTLHCTFEVTTNSGEAVSNGGEFEVDLAPFDGLAINESLGYEDAKITETSPGSLTVVGQPLSGVPRWTESTTAQYTVPLGNKSLFVRGQFTYTGSRVSYNNIQTGLYLNPYHLLSLRSGITDGPWEYGFFARNLLDARPNLGDLEPESGNLIEPDGNTRVRVEVGPPREIGLEFKRGF